MKSCNLDPVCILGQSSEGVTGRGGEREGKCLARLMLPALQVNDPAERGKGQWPHLAPSSLKRGRPLRTSGTNAPALLCRRRWWEDPGLGAASPPLWHPFAALTPHATELSGLALAAPPLEAPD